MSLVKLFIFLFWLILEVSPLAGQSVKVLNSQEKLSLRGLSVVNDSTVWVSGSKGTVGRSLDGGSTWEWKTVKDHESNDFRDIEAFDKNTAVIMAVADPAYILKTTDGGNSWKEVYKNDKKGMFLDAMEFSGDKLGWVIGDPMNGRFFIAKTTDCGDTWKELPAVDCPPADSGEACFASSGTNIRMIVNNWFGFVTGGSSSNLIIGKDKVTIPILRGKSTTGANSFAAMDFRSMIVVGGDFTEKDSIRGNCALTNDGGDTWSFPVEPPHGYRSCVEYISDFTWITCGLNGVDISVDSGKHWKLISSNSYHSCRKAKDGKAVFFSGNNGSIGKLEMTR